MEKIFNKNRKIIVAILLLLTIITMASKCFAVSTNSSNNSGSKILSIVKNVKNAITNNLKNVKNVITNKLKNVNNILTNKLKKVINIIKFPSLKPGYKPVETEKQEEEKIPCKDLIINMDKYYMYPGETLVLDVKKEPENTTDKLIFSSSNENIAKVDENGKITPACNEISFIGILEHVKRGVYRPVNRFGQVTIKVSAGDIEKEFIIEVKPSVSYEPDINSIVKVDEKGALYAPTREVLEKFYKEKYNYAKLEYSRYVNLSPAVKIIYDRLLNNFINAKCKYYKKEMDKASNALKYLDEFMYIQDEYKVNALFALAVAEVTTKMGTNMDESNNILDICKYYEIDEKPAYDTIADSIYSFGDEMNSYFFAKQITTIDELEKALRIK